jgi:hypothetical protein
MAGNWYHLGLLPQLYDVMWCRFPHRGTSVPADPERPVLVRSIEQDRASGHAILNVTYGTKNIKMEREDIDLIITSRIEMYAAGLKVPTRFDLDDSENLVPCLWTSEFFPNYRPSGHIDENCIRRLENRLRWRTEAAAKRLAAKENGPST